MTRPPSAGSPKRTGKPDSLWRISKKGGPTCDDVLSQLGDVPGPLHLMLPTDLAAAVRQELDGCDGVRVAYEAVADGTLLALLHWDTADECR